MRKVDIGRQGLRNILLLGELQSVVIGDGVDLVLRSIMSSDYTFVPFTYNRIAFPVADSGLLSDNSWAFCSMLKLLVIRPLWSCLP